MILRIVLGRFATARDADALVGLRERLSSAARPVWGLESLFVGVRPAVPSDGPPVQAVIGTVWTDVERMARATAHDEAERFLAGRLDLPFDLERTDHYEIVGRTFAALPPTGVSYVRILRIRARPSGEASLIEILRTHQARFVDIGVVASHLGRRLTEDGDVEAVGVSIWPDLESIRAATGGSLDAPLFEDELADWREQRSLDLFAGVEIAPRLPSASGPPMFVLDEELRIVDVTSTAAALLGLPPTDLVGRPAGSLFATADDAPDADWADRLADGSTIGEAAWTVPDVGVVLIRYVAARDVPVVGRHTVVVARRQDPPPTLEDLTEAVRLAFPGLDPAPP
jgi:PAS domain-containing protein